MWVSRGSSDLALLLMWVQLHLALVFHPINCSGPRCDSSSASGSWTSVCWARHRKQPADQPASSPQGGRFESLPRHRHNLPESERKELVCMSGHILQLHHIYRVCVCVCPCRWRGEFPPNCAGLQSWEEVCFKNIMSQRVSILSS